MKQSSSMMWVRWTVQDPALPTPPDDGVHNDWAQDPTFPVSTWPVE